MTLSVDPTVLRRKIAAHARPPAARPDAAPQAIRALGRALRHASTPFEGLGLMPGAITVTAGCDLDALVAGLPDHGLISALEAEGGARGLLAVGPGLIDALVEVQTTGRIEAADLPPRPVTRIDEALVRDFIDLALAALGREAAGIAGRDWPARMAYGSRIRDRGQINLLMPEGAYTLMSADLGFDGVERRSRVVLAVPQTEVEGQDLPRGGACRRSGLGRGARAHARHPAAVGGGSADAPHAPARQDRGVGGGRCATLRRFRPAHGQA